MGLQRLRRRKEGRDGRVGASGRRPSWETGAYWLLYIVALVAALLHWRNGNYELATGCAVMVVCGALLIMRAG